VGHQLVTTVAESGRFNCGVPAPLLFIQTRAQHIHVLMKHSIGMLGFLLAMQILALMDFNTRHGEFSYGGGG
jgi:hypothetical protein